MTRTLFAVPLLVVSFPLYAWNTFGHEVVAAIAWRHMTPEQRAECTEILKAHPHYHDDLEHGPAARLARHDLYVF